MAKADSKSIVPIERIATQISLTRRQSVMLDFDLAYLYGVETRVRVQAVKRNRERFPEDFMFQLTAKELENWRSQIVISNPAAKMGLRRQPYAFTEHGVAMLASVLRSKRAAEVNIAIVRTFIRLRRMLATNEELARKVAQHDQEIGILFGASASTLRTTTSRDHRFREPDLTECGNSPAPPSAHVFRLTPSNPHPAFRLHLKSRQRSQRYGAYRHPQRKGIT
jgi:hypothetical protein